MILPLDSPLGSLLGIILDESSEGILRFKIFLVLYLKKILGAKKSRRVTAYRRFNGAEREKVSN